MLPRTLVVLAAAAAAAAASVRPEHVLAPAADLGSRWRRQPDRRSRIQRGRGNWQDHLGLRRPDDEARGDGPILRPEQQHARHSPPARGAAHVRTTERVGCLSFHELEAAAGDFPLDAAASASFVLTMPASSRNESLTHELLERLRPTRAASSSSRTPATRRARSPRSARTRATSTSSIPTPRSSGTRAAHFPTRRCSCSRTTSSGLPTSRSRGAPGPLTRGDSPRSRPFVAAHASEIDHYSLGCIAVGAATPWSTPATLDHRTAQPCGGAHAVLHTPVGMAKMVDRLERDPCLQTGDRSVLRLLPSTESQLICSSRLPTASPCTECRSHTRRSCPGHQTMTPGQWSPRLRSREGRLSHPRSRSARRSPLGRIVRTAIAAGDANSDLTAREFAVSYEAYIRPTRPERDAPGAVPSFAQHAAVVRFDEGAPTGQHHLDLPDALEEVGPPSAQRCKPCSIPRAWPSSMTS